jgi:hypothetical protein
LICVSSLRFSLRTNSLRACWLRDVALGSTIRARSVSRPATADRPSLPRRLSS